MKYTREKLIKVIKAAIVSSGKSKKEFAKDAGISPVQLSQFIHGHIHYVPTKLLERYDLKRVDTVTTHYEDK